MSLRSRKTGRILDEIRVSSLRVDCTIGLYPEEERRTQQLILHLILYLDTHKAAVSGKLSDSIDYASLVEELQFILEEGRFRLLESAAAALASYILARSPEDRLRASPEALSLEIQKPEALATRALPSLAIFREAEEDLDLDEATEWELLFAGPETALFRSNIPAQGHWQASLPGWRIAALLTGSEGLSLDGQVLAKNARLSATQLQQQIIRNDTEQTRSCLVLARQESRLSSSQTLVNLSSMQPLLM